MGNVGRKSVFIFDFFFVHVYEVWWLCLLLVTYVTRRVKANLHVPINRADLAQFDRQRK